jgi:hypothetical protein
VVQQTSLLTQLAVLFQRAWRINSRSKLVTRVCCFHR